MPGEPSAARRNDGGRQGMMNVQKEQDTQKNKAPSLASGRSAVQQDALH